MGSDVTFTTTNSAGEPILGVSLGSGGVTLGVSGLVSASVGGDSTITSSPSQSTSASDVTFTTTNSNGEPLIGVSLGSGGVSLGIGGTGGGLISAGVGGGADSATTASTTPASTTAEGSSSTITQSPSLSSSSDVTFTTTNSNGEPLIGDPLAAVVSLSV